MKIVNIFGPGAVGKMTVGQELSKITGLRLFHNHKSIEFVIDVFGKYDSKIIEKLRDFVFSEYLNTDNEGLIFTFIWALSEQSDWDLVRKNHQFFTEHQATVYYVELEASKDVRLARNKTPNRLHEKPSKRDLLASEQRMIGEEHRFRMNSFKDEIPFPNYIKINNENLTATEVAKMIKSAFRL